MRRAVGAVLAATALLAVAAAPAPARRCPLEKGFDCRSLDVPLDRSGALPGSVSLRYAIERREGRGVLLALTGGPGQNGIAFGPVFADELRRALHGRRVAVLDQRGTGRSGALSCPEVQGLDGLQLPLPETVESCASRLGARRDRYATADTVEDIEAVRRRLGVERIAIYGVSYGTWVAQAYARRYPQRVERLVLDSVVAPGVDPYDLRSVAAVPRVLRGICARGRCAAFTRDPYADLIEVVRRMAREGGRLRGVVRDPYGGRRTTTLTETDLIATVVATDVNPWLRAQLPAALAAARRGDPVPLLRMRRDVAGGPLGLSDLSAGVFFATTCTDTDLPYRLSTPLDARPALAAAALAALPVAALGPFSRAAIDAGSAPRVCMRWPPGAPAPPPDGPLPDVPTLILAGRDDLRTPIEGARELATRLPRSTLVAARGTGHDVLGSDERECGAVAVRRFLGGRAIGAPCRGGRGLPPAALPPAALGDVAPQRGVDGTRGRVVAAVLATIDDARATAEQALYAGVAESTAGGLRGGYLRFALTAEGDFLILRRNVYVPGVVVTGVVEARRRGLVGTVRVRSSRLSGTLRLRRTRIVGRLGGTRIDVRNDAAGR